MGGNNQLVEQTTLDSIDETSESWDCIECLSGSLQRVQLLSVLSDAQIDLRNLVDELDSPRTTLQRNLTILEKRGWVKKRQDTLQP